VTGIHVRVRLGAERYALPVEHVLEVAELGDVAPVPGAPASVLGVRNLHGEVVPVFSLASIFGVAAASVQKLVVVERDGRRAALAVDEVFDVDVLPDPAEETESAYLRGAVMADDGLVGFIDVERLFGALGEGTA
jgi:purine-binding chemotaxis protein CheW